MLLPVFGLFLLSDCTQVLILGPFEYIIDCQPDADTFGFVSKKHVQSTLLPAHTKNIIDANLALKRPARAPKCVRLTYRIGIAVCHIVLCLTSMPELNHDPSSVQSGNSVSALSRLWTRFWQKMMSRWSSYSTRKI
eukprot:SAG11_NODE_3466_length_2431_cov_1.517153_2_plen_136_part_00